MKFCIISHVLHSKLGGKYFAYGPYVREMNIWIQPGMELIIVAPLADTILPGAIDLPYETKAIKFVRVPSFNLNTVKDIFHAIRVLPFIVWKIYKAMSVSNHIHLRCPGNMGLLGLLVQILFPGKKKTAKYAGNWDWNSRQPWSYRLQQRILRNTFLTRNMTVLVYGDWPDRTKNIKPFFTATYTGKDKTEVSKPDPSKQVNLAFIGTLTANKSPLTTLETLRMLKQKGLSAQAVFCGEGPVRKILEEKIKEWDLSDNVELLGNVTADKVKEVLQQAHFLVFISHSEGWPKAVAEAMWWGCIPVTTRVSCVPQMVGNGERGFLVDNNSTEIAGIIEKTVKEDKKMAQLRSAGMAWAREYTLERFERELKKLI